MASFKFVEITYQNIKNSVEYYLRSEHNKGNLLFSPASPYGQILSVLENLHQMSFLYLKNSIMQFDIGDPTQNNERVVKNAALLAGHVPGRAISATGTLKFTLKTNIDLDKEVPGGRITFTNKVKIKNNTNGLDYSFNLGVETQTHKITPNYQFYIPIIQGKWSGASRTGTGLPLQTYSVQSQGNSDVENFNIEVLVNGEYWSLKKHIYEMLPDEKACVARTGFNGGLDIIFGNGGFGAIPEVSAIISIFHIQSDGSEGNIYRRTRDDWKIIDDVLDGNGDTIDLTKVFTIDIFTDINFGADKEDINFTKSILPISSNNFVLGLPQQYAYEIKKLGVFSHVNAYEKTGTIFIVATPNIKLFKNTDSNYFTIDLRAFSLDDYEKSKIDKYLRTGGNLQLTRKYRVVSPVLSFYVMNVFVITYSDASDDSVNAQILDKISDYFLNLARIDRIPKLDIIRTLSTLTDVHSIDIQFIAKKNEDYHKKAKQDAENKMNQYNTSFQTNISVTDIVPDYIPTETKGIDPFMGDILFEPNEIPIIRGGWYDRNGIYYSDDIDGSGLKSVNIIKKGTVDSKNKII
jgi:hypothetical protein